MTTLHTFGDSILDCGRYNEHGITPGALLVRNDDRLFPEFSGWDLRTLVGAHVRLSHHATDGATSRDLARQIEGARVASGDIALFTIGGNDLLQELVGEDPPALCDFEERVAAALGHLRHARILIGNVYDPSFGDDQRNFLDVDPTPARRRLAEVNAFLAVAAERVGGQLVDLHDHFLRGDAGWYASVIEPSLIGASEVRREFLRAWKPGG